MTNPLARALFAMQDTAFAALPRDGLQTAVDISLIVMAAGSGIALIAVAMVLLQIRKLLQSLNGQLKPVTDRARVAAENVEYISAVVRNDIQKVNESIGAITGRLDEASDHMEDRVHEFNALMEVVQGEAERVFIDTAAAVRGVQAGARSMGRGPDGADSVGEHDEEDNNSDDAVDPDEGNTHSVSAPEKAQETGAGIEAEST